MWRYILGVGGGGHLIWWPPHWWAGWRLTKQPCKSYDQTLEVVSWDLQRPYWWGRLEVDPPVLQVLGSDLGGCIM